MKQLSVRTFDLRIKGKPNDQIRESDEASQAAVLPSSVPFIKPKLTKKIGESINEGEVLFFDKTNPSIQFVSPASGTIKHIEYGQRRRIDEVIIEKTEGIAKSFDKIAEDKLSGLSKEALTEYLVDQGTWPLLRAFPFKKAIDPKAEIPAIYVSLDDLEPFKPQSAVYAKGRESLFKFGLKALKQLSSTVEVIASAEQDLATHPLADVITVSVQGQYPATDPGVVLYKEKTSTEQNKTAYISGQDVIRLAEGMSTGAYPKRKLVTVSGSLLKEPFYCWAEEGQPLTSILEGLDINAGEPYTILGGLITGRRSNIDSYLGFYDDAIQVIPQHHEAEFFNFFRLGASKVGYSKSYLGGFLKSLFSPTAALNGGDRDCIACSYCSDVCPVDLLPQYLFKYLKGGDIEGAMHNGLLDCTECGLCTYVCPSKINLDHQFKVSKQQLHKEAMG